MTDHSSSEPIGRWAGSRCPDRRCTAHKKNGDRCGNPARRGTSVCDFHGAKAPQVQHKARQRIEEATDRMAKELLNMATDPNVADSVKLAAIRDALDRGGITAKSAVELSPARPAAPWEEIMSEIAFEGIAQITQEESRTQRGLPPIDALARPTQEIEVVDAELVPVPDGQDGPERAGNPPADELRALDRVDLPGGDPAAPTAPVAPPPVSVSYEEAAAIMRASRLRSGSIRPGRRTRRAR